MTVIPNPPFFDVLKNRHSARKFKPTPIPKEHITQMLEAACSAPTAGNQQPWKFLVIQDRKKLDRLKEGCFARRIRLYQENEHPTPEQLETKRKALTEYYTDFFSAPLYIIVLTDSQSQYPSYNVYDGPLAADHLLLAAHALGYGTVFVTDSIPDEVPRTILRIPERYQRVCVLPIGIPEDAPEAPVKRALAEMVVYESF